MRAEILNEPPLSGDYEEHNFSTTNDCLWVKFLDEDNLEWVGVFDNNYGTSLKTIVPLRIGSSVLVIVNGQGYSVDLNKRIVTKQTDWEGVENIIYNDETGLYLASNSLGLMVFNDTKCIWTGGRISYDGITFTNQSGHSVEGYLNDLSEGGCKFSFDIVTRELKSKWTFQDSFVESAYFDNRTMIFGVVAIFVLIVFVLFI